VRYAFELPQRMSREACYTDEVKASAGPLYNRGSPERLSPLASPPDAEPTGASYQEDPMYRHVLIPTDGSLLSGEAI
jgi:hypothetical protein